MKFLEDRPWGVGVLPHTRGEQMSPRSRAVREKREAEGRRDERSKGKGDKDQSQATRPGGCVLPE